MAALVLAAATLTAASCSAPEALPPQAEAPGAQFMLSPSNPQIAQGTAQQFSLRALGRDGRVRDVTLQAAWSVSRQGDSPSQRSAGGLVALGAPGRYQVVVEYDGQRLLTPITVTTATLKSLAVAPATAKVILGLTRQFTATATFSDGSTQDVTAIAGWSIKDLTGSGVATVSSHGLATTKKVGKARVTAHYQTTSATATLEVDAAALTALAVSPPKPNIAKGTSQSFTATAAFSNGTSQDVSILADWIVTDITGSSVASIDGSGVATGDAVGQAKITASYLGLAADATLTVLPTAIVSIAISPAAATIHKGGTQAFIAIATLADGTTQDLTAYAAWTSTDVMGTGVASINGSGVATGQNEGKTTIGCTYRGKSATATLTVDSGPPPPPANKVDLLLVVDNSPSMSPKQKALGANLDQITHLLRELNVDYHIGIVSTDIGTNTAPGMPWGGPIGLCDTFAGDDGLLQASPCSARLDVTTDARNACAALCPDSKFVPTDGLRYIRSDAGTTNVPISLEVDPMTGKTVDTGPEKALRCMGLLGDAGCGVESPLEAMKRALDGHRSENNGFLRADALLAVLVITDEDDCSVQMARRNENNPATKNCDPTKPDTYDCYNIDYRCFARSVQCDQTMLTVGDKTHCVERPGNYLEPLDSYVGFLTGLRPPERLVVAGIWPRPSVSEGGKVTIVSGFSSTTPYLNRASGTGASCVYSGDTTVYGQSQLRLSTFASKFPGSLQSSVCDIDKYATALADVGQAIRTKLGK